MSRVHYQSFFFKIILKSIILIQLICYSQFSLYGQYSFKRKISTVVIDPGHGGKDPGTVWKNIYEKDIALSIALKLGNYIKKYLPDVKLIYTRDDDTFIPLNERPEIANKNQADLFISIHVNSNEKTTAEGTGTYAMGPNKNKEILEIARKENAVILKEENYASKYGGFDPNSPVSYIIFSNLQNSHLEQSLNFASVMQTQVKETGKMNNRGVNQAGFLVLWKTTMPSVLIETGFLTNEEDRKILTSAEGQDLIAHSIYKAFYKYKNGIEDRAAVASNADSMPLAKDLVAKVIVLPPIDTSKQTQGTGNNNENDQSEEVIEFMVQISSSKNSIPLNSSYFKDLTNVEELKIPDGYKYAVGRKSSYEETQEYLKIIKNYFPDAFIIALENGKIIPVKEALKKIKD